MRASKLVVYNTLNRKKEEFTPLHPPFVGIYVCGPTVYGDPHLGHARSAISFDIVFRYLKFLKYKVRYVRNITDVGHLENDADQGEDKIAKKARIEKLEPMEVADYYIHRYHQFMDALGVQRPSIEPHASGHIIEQIEMINKIIEAGYAYEKNGSVYFDVHKYAKDHQYGLLSGRVLEDLLENTRTNLASQAEKLNQADFALWKKASPEHIMRWLSPWSDGFPGWHAECSAMSSKYLGTQFDIHGGGMDLMFPHHESEIAQHNAAYNCDPCRYWLHNNMITVNGQKMGKSLGNFITLEEFFTGNHPSLNQAYTPMTIRFFMLQAHYRSTLDFSNDALKAASKALERVLQIPKLIERVQASEASSVNLEELEAKAYAAMDDDFNTPILIAQLFELLHLLHLALEGKAQFSQADILKAKELSQFFIFDILGLEQEQISQKEGPLDGLMNILIALRQQAKENKDFASSDKIRDELKALGIQIQDGKQGAHWIFTKAEN